MNVEFKKTTPAGTWQLSAVVNGSRVTQGYMGYTKTSAERLFRGLIKDWSEGTTSSVTPPNRGTVHQQTTKTTKENMTTKKTTTKKTTAKKSVKPTVKKTTPAESAKSAKIGAELKKAKSAGMSNSQLLALADRLHATPAKKYTDDQFLKDVKNGTAWSGPPREMETPKKSAKKKSAEKVPAKKTAKKVFKMKLGKGFTARLKSVKDLRETEGDISIEYVDGWRSGGSKSKTPVHFDVAKNQKSAEVAIRGSVPCECDQCIPDVSPKSAKVSASVSQSGLRLVKGKKGTK